MVLRKSDKLLQENYQSNLSFVVSALSEGDMVPESFRLLRTLQQALIEQQEALKKLPRLNNFYKEIIIKLKFLSLPLLENQEIVELLKDNFCFQFRLPDYNLWQQFHRKLLGIIEFSERNQFREDVKRAILANNEKIVSNKEINTVQNWLKNYVAQTDQDTGDKLAIAQYMVAIKDDRQITQDEYAHLSRLFNFYDHLSTPSDTPKGFEEEYPIISGGELAIFRKGSLEEVNDDKKIQDALRLADEMDKAADSNGPSGDASPALQDDLAVKLEAALMSYPESSLEHKAISQEISRLKAAKLREAQKSNGGRR